MTKISPLSLSEKFLDTPSALASNTTVSSTTITSVPTNASSPRLKCCILCEPSPLTYVSGYANRFQEMLRFLHKNGDEVHLVTTEVVAADRPAHFLGFPVHYTRVVRLPFYRAMTVSVDWTFRTWRVIHNQRPDLIHASSP
jgi:sulfoquinovosyltransferase